MLLMQATLVAAHNHDSLLRELNALRTTKPGLNDTGELHLLKLLAHPTPIIPRRTFVFVLREKSCEEGRMENAAAARPVFLTKFLRFMNRKFRRYK